MVSDFKEPLAEVGSTTGEGGDLGEEGDMERMLETEGMG